MKNAEILTEWTGLDSGQEDKMLELASRFMLAALIKHTDADPNGLHMQPLYTAVFKVKMFCCGLAGVSLKTTVVRKTVSDLGLFFC